MHIIPRVVDFVLFGGSQCLSFGNNVKILPRKTILLFAVHHLHRDTSFPRHSPTVIPYEEVHFDWFPKKTSITTELYALGFYASAQS